MSQFLAGIKRTAVVVNLDFANDELPYECRVDVSAFLSITKVMEERRLGPNGALIYCMEQLEENFAWLEERLAACGPDAYFLFDCPGQVELFICHDAFRKLVGRLAKAHFRLATVHLIDSHYIQDPAKFVSVLVLTLQSMLQLEYPHVNVLTKIDNLQNYEELPLPLENYTDPVDLSFLTGLLEKTSFGQKHRKLSEALCGLIEEFGMLSFVPFAVEDKECMTFLLQEINKANGYVFGGLTSGNESIMETAMSPSALEDYLAMVEARYNS